MSCSGSRNVETPNLDHLADSGVRFTGAHTISPLCAPARASFYTSQYIHEHGVTSLHKPIPPNATTLPEVLREHGYHTAHLGKWHLSGGAAPSHFVAPYFRRGWDTWIGWENSNRPFETEYSEGPYPIPRRRLPGYQTDGLTDIAIEQITRLKGESPWFMVVSIEPPHDPHVAPEAYMTAYENREIEFRKNVPEEWKTPENIARIKGYYAQIRNLDDNIGRILRCLEETGQADDTIVIYFSDHGDFMGSHNRVQKFFAETESSRIPLIIRHPGSTAPGSVCKGLVSSLDVPTTTLGLLGLAVPASMRGANLSGTVMAGEPQIQRDILISLDGWFDDGDPEYCYRALLTDRHLFVRARTEHNCRLYDMARDPYQMNNLFFNQGHRATREDLEDRLKKLLQRIGDPFYENAGSSSSVSGEVGT